MVGIVERQYALNRRVSADRAAIVVDIVIRHDYQTPDEWVQRREAGLNEIRKRSGGEKNQRVSSSAGGGVPIA